MEAIGYVVLSIDGSPSISRPVHINTDTVFMCCRYGETLIETAHPDHRAWIEGVLTLLLEHAIAPPAPHAGPPPRPDPPDTSAGLPSRC